MEISQNKLIINQQIENVEIFTNFETRNKYSINTEEGKQVLYAYEEKGHMLARQFLAMNRPYLINFINNDKTTQLTLEREFFFILAKHTVKEPSGRIIGHINQKFAWFNRILEIYDGNNQLKFTCISKFPHIWTYDIFKNKTKVSKILKKWSGAKEIFTDADNFLIDFSLITNQEEKALLLATGIAIDMRFFERKKH